MRILVPMWDVFFWHLADTCRSTVTHSPEAEGCQINTTLLIISIPLVTVNTRLENIKDFWIRHVFFFFFFFFLESSRSKNTYLEGHFVFFWVFFLYIYFCFFFVPYYPIVKERTRRRKIQLELKFLAVYQTLLNFFTLLTRVFALILIKAVQ